MSFAFLMQIGQAQTTKGFNYQAVARNNGVLIANQSLPAKFSIIDNGFTLYSEQQNVTTNAYGVLNAVIGSGSAILGNFSNIGWANGNKSIKVEINFGSGFIDMGTNLLQAVPYALSAAKISTPLRLDELQDISPVPPANGQVLKYNGSQWIPAADLQGNSGSTVTLTYSSGVGINVNNITQTISNTGDTNPSDDLVLSSPFGGDVNGPYNNLQIIPNAVGTTEIANSAVTLTKIAPSGASNGQVLKFNGGQWMPDTDNGSSYSAGAGLLLSGNVFSNTGDTNPSDDLVLSSLFAGDVNGPYNNLQIVPNAVGTIEIANSSVTLSKIATTGAANGQVLTYNGGVLAWNTPGGGGLTLPYNGSQSTGSPSFKVTNSSTNASAHSIEGFADGGIGVRGTGKYAGTYGFSSSGSGIIGWSDSGYGVLANSDSNIGVYGKSGTNTGVRGESVSSFGVYGKSTSNHGVYGYSDDSDGISGASGAPSRAGVYGRNDNGGFGVHGSSTSGRGVQGMSSTSYGVEGRSTSSYGVYGTSTNNDGIFGTSSSTSSYGIHGFSASNTAIYGESTVSSKVGVYGENNAASGRGILGRADGTSGIGVYGASDSHYAVYGRTGSGRGVVAEVVSPTATSWSFYGTGSTAYKSVGGSTWSVPSDKSLKSDVRPFTDGLNVLMQIQPKRYYYNGKAKTNPNIEEFGIIAQDMETIAPYTINKTIVDMNPIGSDEKADLQEILVYNGGALQYVTINAIKEQQEKINNLESKNNSLEQQLGLLRNELESLKKLYLSSTSQAQNSSK